MQSADPEPGRLYLQIVEGASRFFQGADDAVSALAVPTSEGNPGAHTRPGRAGRSPGVHQALADARWKRASPRGKMGTLEGCKRQSSGTPVFPESPPGLQEGQIGRQKRSVERCGVGGMFEAVRAGQKPQTTPRADPHVCLRDCVSGAPILSVLSCVQFVHVSATSGAFRLLPGHVGGKSGRNAVFAFQ